MLLACITRTIIRKSSVSKKHSCWKYFNIASRKLTLMFISCFSLPKPAIWTHPLVWYWSHNINKPFLILLIRRTLSWNFFPFKGFTYLFYVHWNHKIKHHSFCKISIWYHVIPLLEVHENKHFMHVNMKMLCQILS